MDEGVYRVEISRAVELLSRSPIPIYRVLESQMGDPVLSHWIGADGIVVGTALGRVSAYLFECPTLTLILDDKSKYNNKLDKNDLISSDKSYKLTTIHEKSSISGESNTDRSSGTTTINHTRTELKPVVNVKETTTKSPSTSQHCPPEVGLTDSSPPEVSPAVSSSNSLPVDGNATPGDRGDNPVADLREAKGEIKEEAPRLVEEKVMIEPRVEPAADLREAEGEVNKGAVCKTTSGGMSSGEVVANMGMKDTVLDIFVDDEDEDLSFCGRLLRYFRHNKRTKIGPKLHEILPGRYTVFASFSDEPIYAVFIFKRLLYCMIGTSSFCTFNIDEYKIEEEYRLLISRSSEYKQVLFADYKILIESIRGSSIVDPVYNKQSVTFSRLYPSNLLDFNGTMIVCYHLNHKTYTIFIFLLDNHTLQNKYVSYPYDVHPAIDASTSEDQSYSPSTPLEVQSLPSPLPLAVEASSNYLSLKSRATPGDHGDKPVADLREAEGKVNKGSCLQDEKMEGKEEDSRKVGNVTSSGKYGAVGECRDKKPHNDNKPHDSYLVQGGVMSTRPQVEPVADLREAEGELNREGPHGEWKDLRWRAPFSGVNGFMFNC